MIRLQTTVGLVFLALMLSSLPVRADFQPPEDLSYYLPKACQPSDYELVSETDYFDLWLFYSPNYPNLDAVSFVVLPVPRGDGYEEALEDAEREAARMFSRYRWAVDILPAAYEQGGFEATVEAIAYWERYISPQFDRD